MTIPVQFICETNARIKAGLQCPECYGVRINCKEDSYGGGRSFDRFECQECGAQWGRK